MYEHSYRGSVEYGSGIEIFTVKTAQKCGLYCTRQREWLLDAPTGYSLALLPVLGTLVSLRVGARYPRGCLDAVNHEKRESDTPQNATIGRQAGRSGG